MSGNYAGYYGEVVSEKDIEIYNKIIEIEEKIQLLFVFQMKNQSTATINSRKNSLICFTQ